MSTQVAIFNPKSNVPAFAKKAELSAMAKALAGGGGGGKRISVKGGVFRLISEGKEVASIEERYLDVVLVAAAPKITRTYYEGTFDAENPSAPTCWSADGEKPDATAAQKQALTCATCPQNIKGSGQGDSRACRFSQRLAVVLANDMEGDVLQLSCAATSIFGKGDGENRPLQEYARWLTAQGHDPAMFVTRLKFDTNSATPKLFFKAMRWLDEEEFEICKNQGATEDAVKAITMTVASMDNVSTVATVAGKPLTGKSKPVAAPEPEPEPEPQAPAADEEPPAPPPKKRASKAAAPAPAEEPDEPVVRKAAAPAAPSSTKSSLSSVIDNWDTDD